MSAYNTHKDLAVHKIMEMMRTAYAQNGTHRSQQVSNYAWGKRSRKVHFISLNRLMNPVIKALLKCFIRFSISFHWYAFPHFCTQFSRPLAYDVRISSKARATADHWCIGWVCTDIHSLPNSLLHISGKTRQPQAWCESESRSHWSGGYIVGKTLLKGEV